MPVERRDCHAVEQGIPGSVVRDSSTGITRLNRDYPAIPVKKRYCHAVEDQRDHHCRRDEHEHRTFKIPGCRLRMSRPCYFHG